MGAHADGMDCISRICDTDFNAIFPQSVESIEERRPYGRRRASAGGSAWAA